MTARSAAYWKEKLIREGWSEGYAQHVAEHLANGTELPDFLTGKTWLPKDSVDLANGKGGDSKSGDL